MRTSRWKSLLIGIGLISLMAAGVQATMQIGGNFSFFYSYGYGEWSGTSPFVANPGFGNGKNPSNLNPWKPEAINEANKYTGALRMMDWGGTNNSGMSQWSHRRPPFSTTQHVPWTGPGQNTINTGVAYEWMVDLCNRSNQDLWICIPHKATYDYVKKMAQLVLYGSNGYNPYTSTQSNPIFPPLKSSLKVYVEYSNEIWNTGFDQHHYAWDKGVVIWPTSLPRDKDIQPALRWGGRRAAECHNYWADVWGNSSRVVNVLAGWHNTSPWANDRIWEGYTSISGGGVDAFATAPYFGMNASPTSSTFWSDLDASIVAMTDRAAAHKTWANGKGLQLITYEGGNHTHNGRDINRDSRMYTRYITFLNAMDNYFTLFCNFNHAHKYHDVNDMWGAVDHFGESTATAHKWRALLDYINGGGTTPPPPDTGGDTLLLETTGSGYNPYLFKIQIQTTGGAVLKIQRLWGNTGSSWVTIESAFVVPSWVTSTYYYEDTGSGFGTKHGYRVYTVGTGGDDGGDDGDDDDTPPPPDTGGGTYILETTKAGYSPYLVKIKIPTTGSATLKIERLWGNTGTSWTTLESAFVVPSWVTTDYYYEDTGSSFGTTHGYRVSNAGSAPPPSTGTLILEVTGKGYNPYLFKLKIPTSGGKTLKIERLWGNSGTTWTTLESAFVVPSWVTTDYYYEDTGSGFGTLHGYRVYEL